MVSVEVMPYLKAVGHSGVSFLKEGERSLVAYADAASTAAGRLTVVPYRVVSSCMQWGGVVAL